MSEIERPYMTYYGLPVCRVEPGTQIGLEGEERTVTNEDAVPFDGKMYMTPEMYRSLIFNKKRSSGQ